MPLEVIAFEEEGKLVGVVGIRLVGVLRPLFLHQRIVIAEVEFAHVGPVAEVIAIGGDGDLALACRRSAREAFLGIPPGVEVANFLISVGGDAEIGRALAHDDIRSAVVERAVHHHTDAPLVEALHESLEFGIGACRRVRTSEHGGDRPVITDGIRTARIEGLTGLRIGVATVDADRVDRLQPKHVHAQSGIMVFVQRIGTPLIATGFARNRRVIDQIEESAAPVEGGVLGLRDERIDLIHVDLERFLR